MQGKKSLLKLLRASAGDASGKFFKINVVPTEPLTIAAPARKDRLGRLYCEPPLMKLNLPGAQR
jgi:hypothetical protein